METMIAPEIVEDATKAQNHMMTSASQLARNITDESTYLRAGEMLIEIKNWRNWWDKLTKPTREAAKLALDNARAMFNKLDTPLESCEMELKRSRGVFRAKAEAEKAKKEQELQAAMKKNAEDLKVNTAAALEKSGNQQMADAMLESPTIIPPVVLPSAAPKQEGTIYRKNWKFRIIDETKIPREYLSPDEKKIGQIVRGLKEKSVGYIPGVEAYSEDTEAVGGR